MSCLLAIDPGLSTLGWAFFEGGELKDCGLSRTVAKDLYSRIEHHRASIRRYSDLGPVVVERMAWRGKHNKGNPQDLMDLSLLAGALGTHWLLPGEWKGSVPRDVEQQRSEAALNDYERSLLGAVRPASEAHNAWSAVGIGLSALGRAHSGKARGRFLLR